MWAEDPAQAGLAHRPLFWAACAATATTLAGAVLLTYLRGQWQQAEELDRITQVQIVEAESARPTPPRPQPPARPVQQPAAAPRALAPLPSPQTPPATALPNPVQQPSPLPALAAAPPAYDAPPAAVQVAAAAPAPKEGGAQPQAGGTAAQGGPQIGESSDIAVVCPRRVEPEMPEIARSNNITGTVWADLRIEGGRVTQVTIQPGARGGPRVFHDAVAAAARQYRCTVLDHAIVKRQSFEFKLTDE